MTMMKLTITSTTTTTKTTSKKYIAVDFVYLDWFGCVCFSDDYDDNLDEDDQDGAGNGDSDDLGGGEDPNYDDEEDSPSSTTSSSTTTTTPQPSTTETSAMKKDTPDPYFTHFDPRVEHQSYKEAQERLEEAHREKVTRVMKDWSDLEERYQDMRATDPRGAEEFKQRMTSRFQQTVQALEEEGKKNGID